MHQSLQLAMELDASTLQLTLQLPIVLSTDTWIDSWILDRCLVTGRLWRCPVYFWAARRRRRP